DDLTYHLTTLFPPVRPRGHLELRMIDAQPGDDGWIVPLAVTVTLFEDPVAAAAAQRAVVPLAEPVSARGPRSPLWRSASRHGPANPELRQAALACFDAVQEALPRLGASPAIRTAVAEFAELRLARGRCPADDLIDAIRAGPGPPVPAASEAFVRRDSRA